MDRVVFNSDLATISLPFWKLSDRSSNFFLDFDSYLKSYEFRITAYRLVNPRECLCFYFEEGCATSIWPTRGNNGF